VLVINEPDPEERVYENGGNTGPGIGSIDPVRPPAERCVQAPETKPEIVELLFPAWGIEGLLDRPDIRVLGKCEGE
jgi:hypothetical protein